MNESCHIWMSHVTYKWVMSHIMSIHWWRWPSPSRSHVTHDWVMSHMNESCHTWMSHVTYEWVKTHTNESRHIWMSHVTYHCVNLQWMSHNIYQWVTSGIMTVEFWLFLSLSGSHGTHEWVMSRMDESYPLWMSHITYEWVTSHINESCHRWSCHVSKRHYLHTMSLLTSSCHIQSCDIWPGHVTVRAHQTQHAEGQNYIWIGHIISDFVMSHIVMSHLT